MEHISDLHIGQGVRHWLGRGTAALTNGSLRLKDLAV